MNLIPVQPTDGRIVLGYVRLSDKPTEWALEGAPGAVLGLPAIRGAIDRGHALRLYATPAGWLEAFEDSGWMPGACVINWRRPAEILDALGAVPMIECETPQLHLRLTATLELAARARLPAVRALWWHEQAAWTD